ncbi:MAG: N-acetyltransferase family protein [Acidobacteria bacterium]|nr:MAG: N-acetyltransferase family protein [Acidobacteriota bacterium]
MEWLVASMVPADWEQVREIFIQGIATGNATFETHAPTWDHWDSSHLSSCRLVARRQDGRLSGWAALSRVSARQVYRGIAEVSVYVANDCRGQGVGAALLEKLVEESETVGLWTLQAHIFPENEASLRLHQKAGFRQVGRRERFGKMGETWRDVLLLERRSSVVGA